MISIHFVPPEFDTKQEEWFSAENNTSWYHESIDHKDNLLVTIGESWTWGDSLGNINLEAGLSDDYVHRTTHVFGNLLRSKLDADWCNIARCGYSNQWIIEKLNNFATIVNTVNLGYKNITVVCTLTELCRDIYSPQMYPVAVELLETSNTLNEFLQGYENNHFLEIKNIIEQLPTNVRVLVGRNFTDTYTSNTLESLVPNTWCDIINNHITYKNYTNNARIVSQIGFDPLIRFLKEHDQENIWKDELSELFDSALVRTDFLDASPYNYKKATKHPTEDGHKLWADYLYKCLTRTL
jgi:hypothetical protein